MRTHVNDGIAGKVADKADFSKVVDVDNLTLVDTSRMDESVITRQHHARHRERLPRRAADAQSRASATCSAAPTSRRHRIRSRRRRSSTSFAEALKTVKSEERMKSAVPEGAEPDLALRHQRHLRRPEQALAGLRVIPAGGRSSIINRGSPADRARGMQPPPQAALAMPPLPMMSHEAAPAGRSGRDVALPPHVRGPGDPGASRVPADGRPRTARRRIRRADGHDGRSTDGHAAAAAPGMFDGATGAGDFPQIDMGTASASGMRYIPSGPLAPTPSGYVPGAPIMATPALGEGLARLQAGETGFDLGGGTFVQFSGIPQGTHNVLRDLQESPLGKKANQLESMTIELVAMLFDFIFETSDLPDGIKALLARLQIPVLKAAMLDGAFFAKKSHPSRLLVNALARSGARLVAGDGPGRSALQEDRRDRPPDPRRLHRQPRDLRRAPRRPRAVPRRGRKGRRGEHPDRRPRRSTRATAGRSRPASSKAEIERRIEQYPIPELPRDVPARAVAGGARARVPPAGRGERGLVAGRRDARGPRLERAAQEDERGSPAPGRAPAVAAEADVGGHARGPLAGRTSASGS